MMEQPEQKLSVGLGAATGEENEGTFWSAWNVLHFDLGSGYMGE